MASYTFQRDKESGTVEVGYIFTFTISAILLTMFTIQASNMINDTTQAAMKKDLETVARSVEAAVENVEIMAMKSPYSYIKYESAIESKVRGYSYSIILDNETLRAKSASGMEVELNLMHSDIGIYIKYPNTGISSTYRNLVIIYDPTGEKVSSIMGNEIVLVR